jgi:3,4-dihydroxy 2-butanone 4-phosphate synthase/GTP cyclohydrolase II
MQYTSVEAREGVTTGISAADRATTIRILGADSPQPRELVKPGHIFPVEARSGGVLVKASVPEAALDCVRLAGYTDAALFVDLLDSSGELLTRDEASSWANHHNIPCCSISELVQYRLSHEPLIKRLSEATVPTHVAGEVRVIAYSSSIHDVEHLAIVKGTLSTSQPVLVRVQVENTIADVFGGTQLLSRVQIQNSLRALAEHGSGVMLYLRRASLLETPLFGISETHPATSHASTATTTMREYGVGAQILRDLGISTIELLSSTQRTLVGLDSFGITVARQRPIPEYKQKKKE